MAWSRMVMVEVKRNGQNEEELTTSASGSDMKYERKGNHDSSKDFCPEHMEAEVAIYWVGEQRQESGFERDNRRRRLDISV